jgi:multimeric flavodoxin WrbA/putative sterol carrier protein
MKRVANALPGVIIAVYMATAGIAGYKPAFMKFSSISALFLIAAALYLRRKTDGASAIDKGFLLYLALNWIVFWAFPGRPAQLAAAFPGGLLYAVLCGAAAIPAIASKTYFTEYFAKKTTPPSVWETTVFKNINRNMTLAWAAIFAACALVTAIPWLASMPVKSVTAVLSQWILPAVLMLGIGVPLNRKYPAYYQRKIGIKPISDPQSAEQLHSKEKIMSNQFKVVAINGSPHGAIANTTQMIHMLASALSEEGVELEHILLADRHIEYCIGCGVCLEKSRCWRQDDHAEITAKLLAADGIILASPVYFKHVTAQMKTFIDRSLAFGHKPRATWKPGLAVTVSAGMAETSTAHYLAGLLGAYGGFALGTLTAIAVGPGAFLGKDTVETRARDLGRDLARAIKEKRRYPATDEQLFFYLFMRDLVTREKDFMKDDYKHWQDSGLLDGFETYVGQRFSPSPHDPEQRKQWLKEVIQLEKAGGRAGKSDTQPAGGPSTAQKAGPTSAKTCHELLKMMPLGFNKEAAGDLTAVYQFEITGSEEFIAHLKIGGGQCVFIDGPHGKPDVIVKSPADVWLAVSRGEMAGQTAFMTGKYKVEGNMALLLRLKGLFS